MIDITNFLRDKNFISYFHAFMFAYISEPDIRSLISIINKENITNNDLLKFYFQLEDKFLRFNQERKNHIFKIMIFNYQIKQDGELKRFCDIISKTLNIKTEINLPKIEISIWNLRNWFVNEDGSFKDEFDLAVEEFLDG
jgi:hypothetical protein